MPAVRRSLDLIQHVRGRLHPIGSLRFSRLVIRGKAKTAQSDTSRVNNQDFFMIPHHKDDS